MRKYYTVLVPLALLAACGKADDRGGERAAPLVRAAATESYRFVDRIEAVGTARANEQVTLSAPLTERITSLNFNDGGYVRRGQVIATLAQGQETAVLAEAQARAREARQQLDRLEQLKQRGFATNSAVDTQVALAGSAQAQAAQARASIGDRIIRAPFSGWVSLRNISNGAVVSAGTEIATVSDLSQIKLDFAIPETLLSAVAPGQAIEARAAAYNDQPFRGTIDSIDPVINPETRAITVRAILPNPDRKLLPGMLLTVTVETEARSALSVPELAIVGEGEDSFVYTIEQGQAKRLQVRTGTRQNGRVEILEGLKPGQRVVTEGVVKLADGQRVRVAGPQNARPARAATPARTGSGSAS
jgi:membrane fusion protein (multidrug efflux system)